MSVITNPFVSGIHAAMMEREIGQASTLADLKRVAKKHGPYLLGETRDRLREQYTAKALKIHTKGSS